MRSLVLIGFVFCAVWLNGQDSSAFKIKLFDVSFHPVFLASSKPTSFSEMLRFTENPAFKNESARYTSEGYGYAVLSDGFDLGLNCSFKLESKTKTFLRRLIPRIGLYYSQRSFENNTLNFRTSDRIDTVYYSNPDIEPLYIDSTSSGELIYKFKSDFALIELGCNIDICTYRYFSLYTGLLYAQGIGLGSEFSVINQESYSVGLYPAPNSIRQGTLKDYTITEHGTGGSISRITIPLGIQYRFSYRRKISPALFIEARPAFETFKKGDYNKSEFLFDMSIGVRLSLLKPK